jgi:hypothetical protein
MMFFSGMTLPFSPMLSWCLSILFDFEFTKFLEGVFLIPEEESYFFDFNKYIRKRAAKKLFGHLGMVILNEDESEDESANEQGSQKEENSGNEENEDENAGQQSLKRKESPSLEQASPKKIKSGHGKSPRSEAPQAISPAISPAKSPAKSPQQKTRSTKHLQPPGKSPRPTVKSPRPYPIQQKKKKNSSGSSSG